MKKDEALTLLKAAGVFYDDEPEDGKYVLNMNDVWCWASAWGQDVPDDQLPELGRLCREYGWPGVLFWASEQNEGMRSEFHDNNRFIDFVRHEEKLKKEEPNSSRRAYKKLSYTLGAEQ